MGGSRRKFFRNAALGSAALGLTGFAGQPKESVATAGPALRRVWIATMTQFQIEGKDLKEVTEAAIGQMENALAYSPDFICLPEVFHVVGIKDRKVSFRDFAEDGSGRIIGPFQRFAKDNSCYVICPVYTTEKGLFYNAAVVIDRKGKVAGEYRKVRLTVDELRGGLTPGPPEPPVFKTDVATIGIQICFDIHWPQGWSRLRDKGAEIVFWPSAFGGGKMVNTKAWENQYCVVASTRKGTAKICDVTGEELVASGNWNKWGVCTDVNLEKIFLHTWNYVLKFPEIQKKYGQNIRIYSLHEEEFSIIESLSDDVKIADIVEEFGLKTHQQHLEMASRLMRELGYES